jgi:hypothetical protein
MKVIQSIRIQSLRGRALVYMPSAVPCPWECQPKAASPRMAAHRTFPEHISERREAAGA